MIEAVRELLNVFVEQKRNQGKCRMAGGCDGEKQKNRNTESSYGICSCPIFLDIGEILKPFCR